MDLIDRIELMRRTYYKGFGNAIFEVFLKCESYHLNPQREDIRQSITDVLRKVEQRFASFPWAQMDCNSDFAPIFVTKELLDRFRRTVGDYLEEPKQNLLEEISLQRTMIISVGELYRTNVKRRLGELKQQREYANYEFVVVDDRGNRFGMQPIMTE